jgi:hypothetical protein
VVGSSLPARCRVSAEQISEIRSRVAAVKVLGLPLFPLLMTGPGGVSDLFMTGSMGAPLPYGD